MSLDNPSTVIPELVDATSNPQWARRWTYYQGTERPVYVTHKIREIFADFAESLQENLCSLAVNSRVNRLQVETLGNPAADQMWESSGLAHRQDLMWRWGLAYGHVYIVTDETGIRPNPPTICYGSPDPDDWTRLAWAGKVWPVGDQYRILIYDETTVWEYTAPRKKDQPLNPSRATLTNESPHGFDQLPVTLAAPYGPQAPVLLDVVAPLQDRINKLGSNKFVAAEFAAFNQRVFFTRQGLGPHDVENAPNKAIILDPGDEGSPARVQELGATDLANYDNAKNNEVDSFFTLASLPRHLRVNPGAAGPSGAAITADELPFIEQILDHQRELGGAVRAAAAVGGWDATPVWRDPRAASDLETSQVVRNLVDSGLPVETVVSQYAGWSDEQVVDMVARMDAAAAVVQEREAATMRGVVG